MDCDIPHHAQNLSAPYAPVALYYEDADSVEYIRVDCPAIYRRVDGFLTLIYDMKRRDDVIGFRLKGFKNFYINHLSPVGDFISMVGALERALTIAANTAFDVKDREGAYNKAREIALEDKVALRGLQNRTLAR